MQLMRMNKLSVVAEMSHKEQLIERLMDWGTSHFHLLECTVTDGAHANLKVKKFSLRYLWIAPRSRGFWAASEAIALKPYPTASQCRMFW